MTGNPFYKTRVILSEELELKLAGRKDYDAIAIAFKQALIATASRPTLDATYSIKALANTTGSETYKDTDNKKRTNSGSPTGMMEEQGGIRYIGNQKWEPGRSLYLTPSRNAIKRNPNQPNFGWLEDPKKSTPEEYARAIVSKPKIRFRKYKVNPKTDEVIDSSEQMVDQFSLNGEAVGGKAEPETKRLPGATIGSRGRSLLQRAAGAFGVLVDEANKFRCPPGTPAANQFTDSMGSNCFGVSASEMVNRAVDLGREIADDSKFRNNVKNFFNFLSYLDNGGIPGIGRTVWRDKDGKRIRNIKKWREASLNDSNSRVFVNGMIRAQERLAQQDKIISDLKDELGVISTPEKMAVNEDIYEVFEKLRASGAWTLDISGRPTKEQVDAVVTARLNNLIGFDRLSDARKQALIDADRERYYETERAILEATLDSFVADPEHMKTLNNIDFRWEPNPRDEANTNLRLTEDTKRLSTVITYHIPEIMSNQEALIPQLAPNERLRIDVTGARTDAEAAAVLTDFLVTVDGQSKQLAAMVEPRAFARHIAKHEIAHTVQMAAFTNEVKRQIETNGFIEITDLDGKKIRVNDVKDLNGSMVVHLMKSAADGLDLESLKNALSRTDVVAFLAGDYPKSYFFDEKSTLELWAIEATAELHALRDLGLIYGDDIDAALEWMDDVSDGKYLAERVSAVEEGMEKIKESYYLNLGPDREILGETVSVIRKREAEERKSRKKRIEDFAADPSTPESRIVKELAINQEERELLKQQLEAMESAGVPDSDADYRVKRDRVRQIDEDDAVLKKAWNERFGSPAKEDATKNKRKLESLIDDNRESAGSLDPEKLRVRVEAREKKASEDLASSLDGDGIIRKLADHEILLKDPATSKEEREKIKKEQKIFRDAYKQRMADSGDERTWAQQRRELEKKIYDIVVPETERVIAKPKKFKTEQSSGSFAARKRKELNASLTVRQENALAELERPPSDESGKMADISLILDPKEQVYAAKQINRRHRKAQRGAAEINGDKTDNASLDQQIENVLIPALEAFETAQAGDNFEVDVFVNSSTVNEIQDRVFIPEIMKQKLASEDFSPNSEQTRIKIQVAKTDRVVLTRGDVVTGDKTGGHAIFPPGMTLRIVDRQEDGTIVARIEKQENMADTLQRLSDSFDETLEGPSPSQHAKGTKKKVDKVVNKYMAQRRQNGMSSVPSQPKPSPAIESRNNAATRTVREAGGAFGEPPLDDYVAEITKTPLIQPAEADIKPDAVDQRTGRPIIKSVSSMSVEEVLNRRAATYARLLDPDYANDRAGFQNVDRGTLRSLDAELVKRGEIVSSLPQPPEFDPDHVPGSKKRSPYKVSSGNLPDDMNSGAEAIGKAQTREQRTSQRRKKVESTVDAVKDILSNKGSDDILPDATKDSVDPAVAKVIFETPLDKVAEQIEKSAVEFHEGIDKRPRVRMTESQLDSFIESGEMLPDDPDDTILESGAIGRRLERRINPKQRRSRADIGFSSGRTEQRAAELEGSVRSAENIRDEAAARVSGLEEALQILEETGEWKGGDLGVTVSVNDVWTANGVDNPAITPRNLTADEIVEIGGTENLIKDVKEKIRISKIEARHQEDVASRKKIRREQGVLDVEDIPDDVMEMLKEEAKIIQTLDTNSDEYKALFGGSEPDDAFVYHAGASELDGGVLDPRRSVGSMEGASRGAGDTRGLNNRQVQIAEETIAKRKPTLDALKALSEWKKNNPQGGRFTASSPEEVRQLETLGLIGSRFKIDGGDELEYEIPESVFDSYGYREIDNTIRKEQEFLDTYQAVLDVSRSIDGQFLSSYPAGKEIVSGGYFGRFAPKTVPEDIASVPSEYELRIQGASQQIKDRDAYDRWMSSRRGTAWLIGGKEGRDITSLLGPGDERQILGEQKPIFGISQLVSPGTRYTDNGSVRNDVLKEVGPALMARAIKLQREGKTVTPESVLSSPISRSTGNFGTGGFSSGRRGKLSGALSSRITDKIVDAALKRSGADEQTKERVKYGMQFAAALAAGGPAGFAAALAQDVARRAGREIAERALEEAVERGHITAEMAEMAMRQVDRVAPNGLPDEVVDKLTDAWSVGSQFLDERVFTEENSARARELVERAKEGTPESFTEATGKAKDVVESAASRVRGRLGRRRRGRNSSESSEMDPFGDSPSSAATARPSQPSMGEYDDPFGDSVPSAPKPGNSEYDDPFGDLTPSTSRPASSEYDDPFADTTPAQSTTSSSEYDDPFADLYTTPQEPSAGRFEYEDDFFSSGKKSGRAATYYNKEYQSRIGLGRNMPSANRPVSGYVVHKSHDEEKKRRVKANGKGNISSDAIFEIGDNDIVGDGLTAFGEIELVLRSDVSQRTAYGRGDSLASAHRPVMMNSMEPEDIADALISTDGIGSGSKDAEAMLHLIQASMDKNFSSINAGRDEKGRMVPVGKLDPSERPHEPFEAHILGGFKKDEVEGIHYPYTKVQKLAQDEDISDVVNETSVKGRLEKLGFTPEEIAYFYSISDSSMMNTPSMQKLREYRAAKKIKQKYEGMGIDYVRIAHPDGINIENPRTYDKDAIGNENVGRMLQQQIISEMDNELKSILEKMRKPGSRDVIA